MKQAWPRWCGVRAALVPGLVVLALPGAVLANANGPQDARTGAPQETTCNAVSCHTDEPLNSGPGVLELILPPSYVPAETYTIDVRLSQTGQMRWGFELTVLDELGQSAGSLAPSDGETQVSSFAPLGREYIKHTSLGTAAGQGDMHAWSFSWTAPPEDVGSVTFYAAGNASDNNNLQIRIGTSGDFVYTGQQSVQLPELHGLAAALGALASVTVLARPLRAGTRRSAPSNGSGPGVGP